MPNSSRFSDGPTVIAQRFVGWIARISLIIVACAGLGMLARDVHADTEFCVSSVSEMIAALQAFEKATGPDVVRINVVQGYYAVGNALGGRHSASNEQVSLVWTGGFLPGCTSRKMTPENTIIDGLDTPGSAISIIVSGGFLVSARIEGLTFNGLSSSSGASPSLQLALARDGGSVAFLAVQGCKFENNDSHHVVELSGSMMHFVNNRVIHNTLFSNELRLGSAVKFKWHQDQDSQAVVLNNTIAENIGGIGLEVDAAGVQSDRISEISGNILWGNDLDIDLSRVDRTVNSIELGYNRYSTSAGFNTARGNIEDSSVPDFDPETRSDLGAAAATFNAPGEELRDDEVDGSKPDAIIIGGSGDLLDVMQDNQSPEAMPETGVFTGIRDSTMAQFGISRQTIVGKVLQVP